MGEGRRTGELFIVQARPETVHARRDPMVLERFHLDARGEVLREGPERRREDRPGPGPRDPRRRPDLEQLQPGEVLVTDMTDPDWEPIMKKAAAIVTNRGGRTCHAAIVSRELGVPAIVGTGDGTVVDHAPARTSPSPAPRATTGFVYAAGCRSRSSGRSSPDLPRPRTHDDDERRATRTRRSRSSFLPNDGVGLRAMEFIISTHDRASTRWRCSTRARSPIARRAGARSSASPRGYADKRTVLRRPAGAGRRDDRGRLLSEGRHRPAHRLQDERVRRTCSAARAFEPTEENPMLGFRGASRYYDQRYRDGFALECRAHAEGARRDGARRT